MAAAWIDRVATLAGGQIGERLVIEDLEHRVAHIEHDVAQGAGRLVRDRSTARSSGGETQLTGASAPSSRRMTRPTETFAGSAAEGVAAVRPERRADDARVLERRP